MMSLIVSQVVDYFKQFVPAHPSPLPATRTRGVGGEGFVGFSRSFLTKMTLPAISAARPFPFDVLYPRGQIKAGLARRVLRVFYEENRKNHGHLATSTSPAGFARALWTRPVSGSQ
jgi:hypothetical protein